MKKLVGYFLQGLLYLVPIAVTIYIVVKAVIFVDGLIPTVDNPVVDNPGVGLLIILIIVTATGFLGGTIIVKRILKLEELLEKVPLLKIIYTSVKDLLSAFVGKKKRFTEPVLVKMEGNIERFGFITQEDLTHLGISAEKIAVYIPFSYAVTGNLIIVMKENVTAVDSSSADIMKFIISGGVTEIEDDKAKKEI